MQQKGVLVEGLRPAEDEQIAREMPRQEGDQGQAGQSHDDFFTNGRKPKTLGKGEKREHSWRCHNGVRREKGKRFLWQNINESGEGREARGAITFAYFSKFFAYYLAHF